MMKLTFAVAQIGFIRRNISVGLETVEVLLRGVSVERNLSVTVAMAASMMIMVIVIV